MSYPAYPEYKDSGVEWLGEVPAHWGLKKIAWHVPYSVGWTPSSGKEEYYDGDNLWVTIADLNKPVIFDTKSKISNKAVDDRGGRLSPAGSMLFSFKLTVGNVSFLGLPAYTNEAIASFEPNENLDLKYWSYAAPQFIPKYGRENIYGALLLNQELIGAVRFYAPDIEEQVQLAAFLDHETARIDALVEEQKRLIALLKEKRQAVISHAVTKGLDPNVPMKDSGVEWLGEVPKHWDVLRIGSVYVEAAEKGLPELPVLRVSIHHGVSDRELNEEEADRKVTRIEDREKYKRVRHGDLVYNMMRAWQGGFGAVLVDGLVSPAYVVARPKLDDMSEFIEQLLRTANAVEEMRSRSYGITDFRLRLYWENFKNLKIALPPREERQEIVNWLQKIIIKSRALESEAGNNISFLEERRSALISAAVTGKIDVRGWQPPEDSVVSTEAKQMEVV